VYLLLLILQYSQLFSIADDAKLVHTIRSLQNAIHLQNDIMNLEKWSIENSLTLNTQKCQFMRHNLIKKNPIIFNYSIFGLPLLLVSNFKDLGVIFDRKLNFSRHI